MFTKIVENIKLLEQNFDNINNERKQFLQQFAKYISNKISNNEEVNLIFICTHNSRRSHMSQIWAQTAAYCYNVPNINCYSGGTEATAFNPRAVKAVSDYGFKIEKQSDTENPIYHVQFAENIEPLKCFSKVYSHSFNPQNNFAAIMTCSDADENCPVVFGAEKRFPIRYNDPKKFDGTELEGIKYRERFEQIGTEILFAFQAIK
jgi:arsenate reductase